MVFYGVNEIWRLKKNILMRCELHFYLLILSRMCLHMDPCRKALYILLSFVRLVYVVVVVLEETGVEDHTGLGVCISGSVTSGTGGSSEAPSLALIKAGCFMWLVRDFEATASPTALTSSSSPVS